jgi:predicted KAP-like P-loop ATPase
VIGADEAMIEYAVRQHFPELPITSGPMPYARNYLEKLIQVPFRIPALGTQETRLYVMLLLISALVVEKHAGFQSLLKKAKESLNQPWLGSGISQSEVEALDGARKNDLAAMYVLAQQIGPILAEGTKGNPRQIKRFLNALFVRHAIAEARGFGKAVNQAVLAKLMLAERFQPDFYELIARQAMVSQDGKVLELAALETTSLEDGKKGKGSPKKVDSDTHLALDEWLEREWLQRWLKIEPKLSSIDLRPYVFVVRDKQALSASTELGGLQGLIEKLCGPEIAVRSVEQQVKTLTPADAQHVFSALSERVLRHGSFTSHPAGFDGLSILAKHHVRFQTELIGILGSVEATKLGIWVVKGWNEIITQESANTKLKTLMTQWAHQDDNPLLKRAAEQALSTMPKGTS